MTGIAAEQREIAAPDASTRDPRVTLIEGTATDMSGVNLVFNLITGAGNRARPTVISTAIIAGWTGRDKEAMEKHIAELEAIGVSRPASTPVYYRVAATRLTTAGEIQVSGNDSSGEAEFILATIDDRLWVGVGSDHTDRKVETVGVTLSKQLCEKPVSSELWPYDEVADHWDKLRLRSYVVETGQSALYQEGPVTTMLDPLELIAGYPAGHGRLPNGALMFCGTLAAKGGIRPAPRFVFELEDPVLGRKIGHAYDIVTLPVAG